MLSPNFHTNSYTAGTVHGIQTLILCLDDLWFLRQKEVSIESDNVLS